MKTHYIPFDKVLALSARDVAYQMNHKRFSSFYKFDPTIDGLKEAVTTRSSFPVDRKLLVNTLLDQSKDIELHHKQRDHIASLKSENTFTVITAHQPSLFTGPAYFVIKILSTIALARRLNNELNGDKVVPVFIVGSEDHDFEEVNHVNIYGNRLEWTTDQIGPVGRFHIKDLKPVIDSFLEILGESPNALEVKTILEASYASSTTYNEFVYRYVNLLFGRYGVIVANMDDKAMKSAFIPTMKQEILSRPSEALVQETQQDLEKAGFSSQAFPRPINLFYLSEQGRNRIDYEAGQYKVINTSITWTAEEIIQELEENPDQFSPNVVMRPLYQESVWPNIAYIGGGGELAYWLERKSQFEHFNVFYPALIRRSSLMIVNKGQMKQLGKLDFGISDLFEEEHVLIDRYLRGQSEVELSLEDELGDIAKAFDSIIKKAEQTDKSLGPFVGSEKSKVMKQVGQIESRIKRSIKKKEETSVNQIKSIKSKLFPNLGLQERHDNFIQFYLGGGTQMMDELIEVLDPLEKDFVVAYPEL